MKRKRYVKVEHAFDASIVDRSDGKMALKFQEPDRTVTLVLADGWISYLASQFHEHIEHRQKEIEGLKAAMKGALVLALCLCASVANAQTVVTGTTKTSDGQTPLAASLQSSKTVASKAVRGTIVAQACEIDSAGKCVRYREVTCGGVLHSGPSVGYIQDDGQWFRADGTLGLPRVANAGCTPSGLATEFIVTLNASTTEPSRWPATTHRLVRTVPDQASVDFSTLSAAVAATPAAAKQDQSRGDVLDSEGWTCVAPASVPTPASGVIEIFCDSTDSNKLKRKNFGGSVSTIEGGGGGGSGTVTSVALSAPAQFSVSGSPVTSSGTLALAWANQSANLVLAGPSSGGAVAPAFRSLVALDIPSLDASKIASGILAAARLGSGTPSSANYLRGDGAWTTPSFAELSGNPTDAQIPDSITIDKFGPHYRIGQFANTQAAVNAVTAAGGGVIVFEANTTYDACAGGGSQLLLKDKVLLLGQGLKGQGAIPTGMTRLDTNNCSGADAIVNSSVSHWAGLANLEIHTKTGQTRTLSLNGGPGGYYLDTLVFSHPTSSGNTQFPFQLTNLTSTLHHIRDISAQNGAGGNSGALCYLFQNDTLVIEKLMCGTGGGDSLKVENSNNIYLRDPFFDEGGAAGGHTLNVVGSTVRISGGTLYGSNSSTARIIKVDATSKVIANGTRIRPFASNVTTTLVEVSGDGSRFENMWMNEGTFTNAFLFNSGADNNLVTGHVSNTINNSGANNRHWVFNGSIWTGNISDAELAQITTASKVHGSSITGLASVPGGAGLLPAANTANLENLNGTLTVAKGGTGAAPGGGDQVLVSDSTSAATWRTIPDCDTAGTSKLLYDQATNTWSCGTDQTGGGSAHEILSATHTDSAAAAVARGAGIFGIGASPAWTLVQLSATDRYFKRNSSGDVVESSSAAAGTGTCTNQFARALNADASPTCASVATADITDAAVTSAKLRDSAAVSVIGRSANSTGVPADIAAAADGAVLRRAAGAVGFGQVDLADTDAVTGVLPAANVATSIPRVLHISNPGETITNSASGDIDFASVYSVPANHFAVGSCVRVTFGLTFSVGTSTVTMGRYVKVGSTKVYTETVSDWTNSQALGHSLVMLICGTAAPGASESLITITINSGNRNGNQTENNTAQPVAGFATNGTLAITSGVTFSGTGSTENHTLRIVLVEGLITP